MNVQKFTAATSRDALRKVREALGPDAVILSNRPVDGVVEILALATDDAASISAPAAGTEMAQPAPSLQLTPHPPESYANRRAPAHQPAADMFDMSHMAQMSSMMSAAIAHAKDTAAAEMSGMMSEIRAMRGLMETQLAAISWSATAQREPEKAGVLREMLAAGFSVSLARYLIEKMPAGKDAAESMRWVKTVL